MAVFVLPVVVLVLCVLAGDDLQAVSCFDAILPSDLQFLFSLLFEFQNQSSQIKVAPS